MLPEINVDHLESPLHRWDPRAKVVGLLGLIAAFGMMQKLGIPMLLTAAGIYGLSRLPLGYLWRRIRYPGVFILTLVIVLPLMSGETILWQWGGLALRREGLEQLGLIVCRFLSILTLSFVLLGTTPWVVLLKTLQSLGLPVLLTDMMALTYRYLFEVSETFGQMRQAMRLRGFRLAQRGIPDGRAMQQLAALLGTLLLRSYERSEQVYQAMRLRGYGSRRATLPQGWGNRWSRLGLALALVWGIGLVMTEWFWLG